jgi:hypothetical protein
MASEAEAHPDGRSREAPAAAASAFAAPWWLRPARGVSGVVLLALAWATIMVGLWLASVTLGIPPHRHVVVRLALYVLGAVGTCWLGLMALAAVLVGAFCLMLALTERGW